MKTPLSFALAVAFAGATLACGGDNTTTAPGALASIVVTPNTTLAINATQQFVAVGKDAAGGVVAITPAWSVTAGGGTVSSLGLFTAGATPGVFTSTVKATSGTISGSASVTVTVGAIASIVVSPAPGTLAINGTQQFAAVAKDVAGNVVPFTPTWLVLAGGGTISASGLFTAGSVAGTFTNTVRASTVSISGAATVVVNAGPLAAIAVSPNPASLSINGTQQYTALGTDVGGNVVAFTPTWLVLAGGGTISSTGLFTAGTTPGTFTNTVRASTSSISGSATVVITLGSLATITVSPSPMTLAINGTQQYTAVGADAAGNAVAITPVWSVVANGGAISASGLFTAGTTPGVFTNTVKATSGAISGTATVTVTTGALATITVTPSPVTLAINATQQYTAVGKDAGNNVLAITPVWSVVASGGAISASGLFTAGTTPGVFTNTVKATSGAISGTATVNVTAGPLATITVTPNPVTLASSATQQYSAVGKDAGNNILPITPVWSVVASGGSINASGLFTAGVVGGTFTNTVKATSGAISGTATVTVTVAASGPAAVNLGTAGNYVILAQSAISTVPTSDITGDLGISPAAASFITGFALNLVAASPFSTSSQVTGNIYAPGYANPTPADLTTAIGDMQTAYTDAAGRVTPDFLELGTGEIGTLTLVPGLYKWTTTVSISNDVTLNGSSTSVWIFQISGDLTQAAGKIVHLTGGALATNVFWQVAGAVAVGTTAHMEGNILSKTSITLGNGASANGKFLAQTNVALDGNIIVKK